MIIWSCQKCTDAHRSGPKFRNNKVFALALDWVVIGLRSTEKDKSTASLHFQLLCIMKRLSENFILILQAALKLIMGAKNASALDPAFHWLWSCQVWRSFILDFDLLVSKIQSSQNTFATTIFLTYFLTYYKYSHLTFSTRPGIQCIWNGDSNSTTLGARLP